jgi:hypothetical protein
LHIVIQIIVLFACFGCVVINHQKERLSGKWTPGHFPYTCFFRDWENRNTSYPNPKFWVSEISDNDFSKTFSGKVF